MLLALGSAFVAAAGVQLYVLSAHTDRYFAWTIANPLTAATIGALYFGALPIAGYAARQHRWDLARVGLPGVLVFLWLTLAASVIHLSVFHLHATYPPARVSAYAWLLIYLLDPPLLLLAYVSQVRRGGAEPAGAAPVPSWYRLACVLVAAPVVAIGVLWFVAPESASGLRPWSMPPIAARTTAAWLVGLGLLLLTVAREGDWLRNRPASLGMTTLGVLQLAALARYPHIPRGTQALAWVVVWAVILVLGACGGYAGFRRRSS